MGKRIYITIIASTLSLYSFAGINIDSLLQKISRWSFYCLPTLTYQPETKYAFGIGGGYNFRFLDPTKISTLSFNETFTQNHQFSFSASPRLYFGGSGKWYVYSNINVQKYPDTFHGTGNAESKLLELPIKYTSRSFSFTIQPQRFLTKHIMMGLNLSVKNEKVVLADSLKNRASAIHVTGWQSYFLLGLGGVLSYDSRNTLFYPTNGLFSKFAFIYYDPRLGSTYNIVQFSFDFRQYIPICQEHVFAWQFYTDWRLGNAIPFQMLTTIGGNDIMRGFSRDIYRDNVMAAIQGEYRFPIYNTWRGAIFCSTGDVLNSNNFMIDRLKFAYGAGIRFRITRAKVNCRIDFTRNNYYKGFQYYFTAMEAF